jgi:hypothetical protein
MQFNWTKLRLRTALTILTGVVCTTIALAGSADDPERSGPAEEEALNAPSNTHRVIR